MSSYSLDVELFISEVQKYPELWDIHCEEYRHKYRKIRAWGEVAKVFVEDYDVELSATEKDEVCKYYPEVRNHKKISMKHVALEYDLRKPAEVQNKESNNKKLFNKWRNIRDSYVRHLKKKYGKKGYLYANNLTFLSDVYKQTNLSGSDGEEQNDESWPSDDENKKDNLKKLLYKSGFENEIMWQNDDVSDSLDSARKKRKMDIEFVETNFTEATSSLDGDKSFFDSLLPAVKDFTIDQKLEFRCDIIKLIKSYRQKFDLKD